MSVLNGDQILNLIKNKNMVENYDENLINAASLDIRLGNHFFKHQPDKHKPKTIIPGFSKPNMLEIKTNFGLVIKPNDFVLAQSMEFFNLPEDICASFVLSSSLGRLGLEHAMSGFCNPGWKGSVLTLELTNQLSCDNILLEVGMKIGQIVFSILDYAPSTHFSYNKKGNYLNDKNVMQSK